LHDAALHGSSHYDLPGILRWLTANIGVHPYITYAAASRSIGCRVCCASTLNSRRSAGSPGAESFLCPPRPLGRIAASADFVSRVRCTTRYLLSEPLDTAHGPNNDWSKFGEPAHSARSTSQSSDSTRVMSGLTNSLPPGKGAYCRVQPRRLSVKTSEHLAASLSCRTWWPGKSSTRKRMRPNFLDLPI
jgi:hypothetical protein